MGACCSSCSDDPTKETAGWKSGDTDEKKRLINCEFLSDQILNLWGDDGIERAFHCWINTRGCCFRSNVQVPPIGSPRPGDQAHLLLGIGAFAFQIILLHIGAVDRRQGDFEEMLVKERDDLFQDWRWLDVECVTRVKGDLRPPPIWFLKAFPSVDTSKMLVGYEVCDIVRECMQARGWTTLSVLEVIYHLSQHQRIAGPEFRGPADEHQVGVASIGKATHFFSHSHCETVLESTRALHAYWMSKENDPLNYPLFFIDYFNIRQCTIGDYTPIAVPGLVQQIGRTVSVLNPLHSPVTLTRAWCVYEIACTLSAGAGFEAVPAVDYGMAMWLEDMLLLADSISVDLDTCTTREAKDKEGILDIVRSSPGSVKGASSRVQAKLRSYLREGMRNEERMQRLMNN